MNLRQMEIFHAVVEAGSVTGAARILNISQPAVTNMLRHMEDLLRFSLFQRVKGRLEPTAEGRLLYAETTRVFDRVDSIKQLIDDVRNAKVGFLDIACAPNVSTILIPRVVSSFVARNPNVRTRLHVRRQIETTDMVASELVNFGVALMSMENPRVKRTPLAHGNLIVIAPPGHRFEHHSEIEIKDLHGERVISYGASQGLARLINGMLAENRVDVEAICEVNVIDLACKLVGEGMGVALIDNVSLVHLSAPHIISRPLRPNVKLTLELLEPVGRSRTILANKMIDHMQRYLNTILGV